ncbi:MAG: ankyrin repeat domain-containing protein [Sandaracinaceae bacterium]
MNYAILAILVVAVIALAMFMWRRPEHHASATEEDAPPDEEAGPVAHTALGCAIVERDVGAVQAELAKGPDLAEAVVDDLPPLLAATAWFAEVVPDVIAAGAPLDHCDRDLGSALMIAAVKREIEAARVLVEAGIPIDLMNDSCARALHMAAYTGGWEMLDLLLDAGASVDQPTLQGGTPLRAGAARGYEGIVIQLMERGADPHVVDKFGERPADYARKVRHPATAARLEAAPEVEPSEPPEGWPVVAPLTSHLPRRGDASIISVAHALERGALLREIACSSIEAPSVLLVVRRVASPRLTIGVGHIDDPDPRIARRDVELLLYRYEGNEPSPVVDPPPPEAVEAAADLARRPYHLALWSDRARATAASFTEAQIPALAAVMAYPPESPAHLDEWDAVFRAQTAAALLISHVGEGAWIGSARRSALFDLTDGPVDWSNTAAIIALYDVARRETSTRADVVEHLLELARLPITPPTFQHLIVPAATALLCLGELDDDARKELRELVGSARSD